MDKWDLTTIFKTQEEWKEQKEKLEILVKQIESYQGKLGESSKNIAEVYALYEQISEIFEKLYSYSMLSYHQNMADTS